MLRIDECWYRPNEESLSGQRLSKDHSWKTAEMIWAPKNIKQHLHYSKFKRKSSSLIQKGTSAYSAAKHYTGTSHRTEICGQMKLKKWAFWQNKQ